MAALSWPILGHTTGGSSGEHHLDLKPVDTSKTEDALRAAETACQSAIQQIPQEVEVSQELLRYPEGEGDAVPITERDMEELQPGKFLGDNIVDFYIRFLQRKLPPEHGKHFYFFNSFFFTKLLQSTTPTHIDPCKVDYEQLRRWTEKVNLFEKDYVFIPIVKSSHWSLIIICHLSSLTRAPDEMMRFPYMVHLDPIEGQHESFEGVLRSYVLQAWMERFHPSIDKDQLLALYQMKYVQVEVPQQANSHDCGLYVLSYVEAFLVNSTSPNFNFASSEIGVHFTSPHFVVEVLSKRMYIQNLILELIQSSQERTRKCTTMKNLVQELLQASQNLRFFLYHEGYSKACIKDVQPVGPSFSNGEDCEMTHTSNHEDSMDVQHQQSTLKSRGNNEPWSDPQIGLGFVEYENRSDCLSPKQQPVEPTNLKGPIFEAKHVSFHEDSFSVQHQQSSKVSRLDYEQLDEMQTVGPTNLKGPILEAKHAATLEDLVNVQHQQPSGISRLDYEQLDGLEHQHVEYERVTTSFSDKLEEIPCMDSSKVVKGKNKRGKNMTHEETSMLLSCKVEGGRFCKGSGGATHWNLISKEIEKKLGSRPSADQCRLRYDTLLKAYKTYKKHCMKTGKTFSTITEEERLDLKLATTLCKDWYTTIGKICDKAKSPKRIKINPDVCTDLHPWSSHDPPTPNPPPISHGRSFEDGVALVDSVCRTGEVVPRNSFPTEVSSSLNEDLQSTLLNLVQECSRSWQERNGRVFSLERVCRRLAILQDREPGEILNYVFKLWELQLVSVADMDFEDAKDLVCIDLWKGKRWLLKSWVYEEISKEVLRKNPHLKTYYNSFPIEQSLLQYVKVLSLDGCYELKYLNLKEFPNLRVLAIYDCPQFNLVTGWEVATSLGSLSILECCSYRDFPNLQYFFSLRELEIDYGFHKSAIRWESSQFNQCAKLRRLKIWYDESLLEIAYLKNLKDLKFLEFLSLLGCTFSSIQGLSALQGLKTLDLRFCKSLRRVPDLGCLKGLIELDMGYSGVEDVVGVGKLHLLTSLDLRGCESLKWLPFLGHLKALVYLNVSSTGVKKIPGREDLINLKTLHWDIE